jgi:hypothetical protein
VYPNVLPQYRTALPTKIVSPQQGIGDWGCSYVLMASAMEHRCEPLLKEDVYPSRELTTHKDEVTVIRRTRENSIHGDREVRGDE